MLCISFLAIHVNLVAIIGIRNVIDKKKKITTNTLLMRFLKKGTNTFYLVT